MSRTVRVFRETRPRWNSWEGSVQSFRICVVQDRPSLEDVKYCYMNLHLTGTTWFKTFQVAIRSLNTELVQPDFAQQIPFAGPFTAMWAVPLFLPLESLHQISWCSSGIKTVTKKFVRQCKPRQIKELSYLSLGCLGCLGCFGRSDSSKSRA